MEKEQVGVNALNGLLLFLPKEELESLILWWLVSTPSTGFSYFYWSVEKKLYSLSELCQRPQRASLISTVPSHTPHKYWLFRLIFAGICLNILKSSFFRLFSGMFIICSYLGLFFCPLPHKHYTLAFNKMKATFLIFSAPLYFSPLLSSIF